jgi:hypothetical protein
MHLKNVFKARVTPEKRIKAVYHRSKFKHFSPHYQMKDMVQSLSALPRNLPHVQATHQHLAVLFHQ